MKKKNGPHCLVSDQPLNFDLILNFTLFMLVSFLQAVKAVKKAIGIFIEGNYIERLILQL